jgi:hypothetical protein
MNGMDFLGPEGSLCATLNWVFAYRLKDKPAQALYEKAGYRVCKKDNVFVKLLGQDRRYLMHKRLTPGVTPGSA